MVYGATEVGLNEVVQDPQFTLPTIESDSRSIKSRTYMADCDVEEISLNFMIYPRIIPNIMVDLSSVYHKKDQEYIHLGQLNGRKQ